MELSIRLDRDGRALARELDKLTARLGDLGPALREAGRIGLASVRLNFEAQGRPDRWPPLSPGTAKRKGRAEALIETGYLLSSIYYDARGDTVSIVAPAPYAGDVQKARPFLVLQDEDVEEIKGIVTEHLLEAREG